MTITEQRSDLLTERDARPLRRAGARATTATNRSSTRTSRSCARAATSRPRSRPTFGGGGLDLAEINQLQRRIAYVAPATAVAVNMHHYFVGLCADLHRAGDPSGDWVLRAGRRRARLRRRPRRGGQRHPGAAVVVAAPSGSTGGWEITGHKIFGSLSPVWTYLGVHAMDTSDPANPQGRPRLPAPRRARLPHRGDLGHARHAGDDVQRHHPRPRLHPRRGDDPGVPGRLRRRRHVPGGDVRLGAARLRRASTRRSPSGRSTTPSTRMHERTSIALTRSMAYHPEVQHHVAEMRIHLEAMDAHLDRVCDDWATGVDHGMDWPTKIVACKYDVVTPGLGGRRHRPRPHRRQPASSSAAASSSCSATPGSGASTPATRCSPTSSSAS